MCTYHVYYHVYLPTNNTKASPKTCPERGRDSATQSDPARNLRHSAAQPGKGSYASYSVKFLFLIAAEIVVVDGKERVVDLWSELDVLSVARPAWSRSFISQCH